MRNFSMKKFGTPMRAGPGVASESVGLSSVGEPSVWRVGLLRSTCFLAFFFVSLELAGQRLGVRVERGAVVAEAGLLAALAADDLVRVGRQRARRRRAAVAAAARCRRCVAALVRRRRAGAGVSRDVRDGGRRRRRLGRRDRAEVGDRLDGRRQAGDLDRLDGRAGRHVDGRGDRLAGDERDGDAVQLGGSGHDEEHAEQGGGCERDAKLPSSHWVVRVPSPAVSARCCPRAPVPSGPSSPVGVVAPYWSNMPVAIQERIKRRALAPFGHLFDDGIGITVSRVWTQRSS